MSTFGPVASVTGTTLPGHKRKLEHCHPAYLGLLLGLVRCTACTRKSSGLSTAPILEAPSGDPFPERHSVDEYGNSTEDGYPDVHCAWRYR